MINKVRYLDKKVAKVTIDFSAQRAIDSLLTFDAADISAAADTITIAGHSYKTGDAVAGVLTVTTGVTATAPAMKTAYWVIYVDKDTIALATSLALAKVGTKTALTAGGCVDMYLQRNSFGLITTDLVIPLGAIVTGAWFDIITTCVSDDGAWGGGTPDKATMSIGISAAADLIAAIAIETGTIWDASRAGSLVGTPILGANAADGDTAIELAAITATKFIKTTTDAAVNLTIAVDPISQGKMDIYVEYFVPSLA